MNPWSLEEDAKRNERERLAEKVRALRARMLSEGVPAEDLEDLAELIRQMEEK